MRPQDLKILLVQPEEPLRRLLETWLRQAGYPVVTAKTAEEARALFPTEKPALVVTDITLPGRSGLTLLRSLKRRHSDTPIVLLTARQDVHTAAKAVRWEAFDYLIKPVARVELLATLTRAMQLMRIRRDMRAYTQEMEKLVQQDQGELNALAGELIRMRQDLAWIQTKLQQMRGHAGGIPDAGKEGKMESWEPFSRTLSELSQWVQDRQESLRGSVTASQERSLSVEKALRNVQAEMEPRLIAADVDLTVEIPKDIATLPAGGPHIHGALEALLSRGIEEVARRKVGSLHLSGGRKGQRLLVFLEFPSAAPDTHADPTVAWMPNPWVRRRILWSGLSRAAAHAKALGGRLLVDGSQPGLVRWILRLPLKRQAGMGVTGSERMAA
ncbi:MAG: response regulator [Candidatus Eisenbacteria bacterium]|uniref:Response regulator n=1 Tax=Eiseniibacteriota bacterium TaxID=2212470 RepID=A0A948RRF0_UNCEI|nr:response regulator [Candidatus Eisenbacteria bacterium]MBU1947688.1 response regulator [Candidatus Eisenbacteria bacterium]MBU2689490.1 response regulator [Candidatus Eisenbacteria bacterium]